MVSYVDFEYLFVLSYLFVLLSNNLDLITSTYDLKT